MSLSIGMIIFGIVLALLGIVQALLPSTMSYHMEDAVLFGVIAAPSVFIIGLIVATNIELEKLDRSTGDWHDEPGGEVQVAVGGQPAAGFAQDAPYSHSVMRES